MLAQPDVIEPELSSSGSDYEATEKLKEKARGKRAEGCHSPDGGSSSSELGDDEMDQEQADEESDHEDRRPKGMKDQSALFNADAAQGSVMTTHKARGPLPREAKAEAVTLGNATRQAAERLAQKYNKDLKEIMVAANLAIRPSHQTKNSWNEYEKWYAYTYPIQEGEGKLSCVCVRFAVYM